MKAVTRNRWWPAALAVAGVLAAFAALTAPGRDTAEAQSLCAFATGEALQQFIAAGVCAEPSPTPAPGNTPLPPPTPVPTLPPPTLVPTLPLPTPVPTLPLPTLVPTLPPAAPVPTPTPAPSATPVPTPVAEPQDVCETATDETLSNLIQDGVCAEPPPPTPAPENTPVSTPTPEGNDVIVVTGDTVPGRLTVRVYGLISAEVSQVDEAKSALMEQAAAVGANAVVDFHLAVDHDVRIAYGTAVATDCTESVPCLETESNDICHPILTDESTLATLIAAGVCRPEDMRTLPAPLLGENDVTLLTTDPFLNWCGPVCGLTGKNAVTLVTTDTVPRHSIVRVHGLVTNESDPLFEAQYYIIEQAATAGTNAVIGFRSAADRGLRIAYGTAVTIK